MKQNKLLLKFCSSKNIIRIHILTKKEYEIKNSLKMEMALYDYIYMSQPG